MSTHQPNTHAALAIRIALSAGLCAGIAQAAPSGGEVDSGSADIRVDGDTTTITTGHTTIMSWDSFDIASHESVEFIMPGASSRVLNRINSVTPTTINGTLSANGQVYLVNSSGIVFGADSVVNVGALYAAAGNISNTDFINGNDRFTGLTGTVENRGSISAGEIVTMVGARVTNIGSISAPEGTVVMAAGEEVVIGDLLGHAFVTIEKPVTDDAAPLAGGSDLAAGDMFSIAAFHSGSIDASHAVVAAKGGDTVVSGTVRTTGDAGAELSGDNLVFLDDGPGLSRGAPAISGPSVTLTAAPGGVIDLGVDVHATVDDINLFGDVRLTDSVTLTASGFQGMVIAHGDIYSQAGAFHNLTVSTPTGVAEFRGALGEDTPNGPGFVDGLGGGGTGAGTIGSVVGTSDGAFTTFEIESGGPTGGDLRLGFYEVSAPLSLYEKNVLTRDGMNILSEAGITGERVVFHTGTGDALFAADVYSAVRGASDIAFLYDAGVNTGVGTQRVPFSFRGNIGTPPVTRLIPTSGAFRTIEMGADAGGFLTSASFFFSTGARGGGALSDLATTDTSERFFIAATESILVGRGQKITALGSIQLSARGDGATHIETSDINAIGDITLFSRSRIGDNTITLLRHEGGLIDGVENETNRSGAGFEELGGELIAGGDILFVGALAPDTDGVAMGYEPFVLANSTGSGSALGLTIDALGFNPATMLEFLGTQPVSTGGAYAYDLTLGDFIGPSTPGSLANLAEGLADENTLTIRDDAPYLAQREVLRELGLNPVDPAPSTQAEGARIGREVYLVPQEASQALTIDRLSKLGVERFVGAYIELLGERDPITGRRRGLDRIHDALAGDSAERERVLERIRVLVDRLELLELTELELRRAKASLFTILSPDGLDTDEFSALVS